MREQRLEFYPAVQQKNGTDKIAGCYGLKSIGVEIYMTRIESQQITLDDHAEHKKHDHASCDLAIGLSMPVTPTVFSE